MPALIQNLRKFLRFEGVSLEIVLVTAFISYILQINAIISGDPLYLIALVTLLPWIPLAVFEGVWKVKNYSMIAVLGLFTILQLGHFGEHLIQVIQLNVMGGTVACPPPVDNMENAARAVAMGLRDAAVDPSFYSVSKIMKAGADGLPMVGADGAPIIGPAACAVFGQLDLEVVHLIWELMGYFGTAVVLMFFPRNRWLFIALLCLSWHALEHLTISYFYYFDQEPVWYGFRQLWAVVPDVGNTYMAVPAGKEEAMLNFYQAGGKFGLMANNGLFEQLTGYDGMPGRAVLHMGYNAAITIPTVIGFAIELRHLRNRYLEEVFVGLSRRQLVSLSNKVEHVSFAKDEVILHQGDPAHDCYLLIEGTTAVLVTDASQTRTEVARIGPGSLFGEMGLLENKPRSADVVALQRCTCLRISGEVFAEMTDSASGELHSPELLAQLRKLVEDRQRDTAAKLGAKG